ncbi:unnamed protein product [[Candida] boidinii]|nr:unnamed protein product [[Candida] boidinii]
MTTFEKIVKMAPPKPKYIEPILMATADGDKSEDFRVIMKTLANRVQDTALTIVYKSLIVAHIMIREGDEDVTIRYLSRHPNMLECRNLSKSQGGGGNGGGSDVTSIINYSKYLIIRSKEYAISGHDFIKEVKKPVTTWTSKTKDSGSLLRNLSIEKGLLRQVESVQRLIDALIRCKMSEHEVNNDVVILAFRMLVNDLLTLYQTLNEGVINILEHFFELSKPDAERALDIYKKFTKETNDVVAFLRIAKHLEYATKLHKTIFS